MPGYDVKEYLLDGIKKKGGFVNAHGHFDRAFTLTKENFKYTTIDFQKKWQMNVAISKASSVNQIYERMQKTTEVMLAQGVQAVGTFLDAYPGVEDKSLQAAEKLRSVYGKQIKLVFINQPLQGLIDPKARKYFDMAANFVDILGGLPSRDGKNAEKHLDILFKTAKKLNKPVHVHVDQLNLPTERETEMLVRKTVEHKLEGKVTAIHSISVAAQKYNYRQKLYKKMAKAKIMVVSNPTAYIDDPRKEIMVPSHNSVTPVDEMAAHGIVVAIGADNINDLHKPFTDGDMWTELRVLLEACRFFDLDKLIDIASINGLRVLGLKK